MDATDTHRGTAGKTVPGKPPKVRGPAAARADAGAALQRGELRRRAGVVVRAAPDQSGRATEQRAKRVADSQRSGTSKEVKFVGACFALLLVLVPLIQFFDHMRFYRTVLLQWDDDEE